MECVFFAFSITYSLSKTWVYGSRRWLLFGQVVHVLNFIYQLDLWQIYLCNHICFFLVTSTRVKFQFTNSICGTSIYVIIDASFW